MGKSSKKGDDVISNDVIGDSSKPLPKLVLKFGKERDGSSIAAEQSPHDDVHHKKKKKKHKHKSNDSEKKMKKRDLNTESNMEETTPAPPKKRSKEAPKIPKAPEYTPFQLCLGNLHKNLQRKDVYSIFTFPVTDAIAPGYSKIIKQPMDFLTMQKKIDHNEYISLDEFREDFELMCSNAMTYNGSDTIYYKSAEKMLLLGHKMLSKGKVKKLSKALGVDFVDVVDVESFDNNDVSSSHQQLIKTIKHDNKIDIPTKKKSSKVKQSKESKELITESVLIAAEMARKRLLEKNPKQLYGYVSKDDEGKFVYNILNREEAKEKIDISFNSKFINNVSSKEEEKKKRMASIQQLWYGPFGSFGPAQDVSLSKLTKDESDLLLKTYGTDLGVTYAKSIQKFVEESTYAANYVDRLLDIITNGAHSAKMKPKLDPVSATQIDKEKNIKDDLEGKDIDFAIEVDMKSLETLSDIGIDVSFLSDFNNPDKNTLVEKTQQ